MELLQWCRTDVDGRSVAYGVGGSGPPVVFLHGWGLSDRTYRAALKRLLARGMRVYAPAFPGCGGSAKGPAMDLSDYAAFVDAFCDAVGLREPVVLMGHSFGGGVAIQTAHDFPERVRGLVLIDSIGGGAWRPDGSTMAQRPLWDWGLHFPRDVLPLRQIRRVVPVVLDAAIPNLLRHPFMSWQTATLARRADLSSELEELKRQRVPVVVLWGRRDELITRASNDALCEALGDPLAITVDGSHSWMLAEPDRFGEVITNVLPALVLDGPDSLPACRHAQSVHSRHRSSVSDATTSVGASTRVRPLRSSTPRSAPGSTSSTPPTSTAAR